MNEDTPKIIATSTVHRAGLTALDNDIKMLEMNSKLNNFTATPENIEMKKLEMEQMKINHEKQMLEADQAKEADKITKMFEQ